MHLQAKADVAGVQAGQQQQASRHRRRNPARRAWRADLVGHSPCRTLCRAAAAERAAHCASRRAGPRSRDALDIGVAMAFGAAAGALIVRFLTGRGLMRAAIGAGVGGLLGSLFGGALGGGPSTMNGFAF